MPPVDACRLPRPFPPAGLASRSVSPATVGRTRTVRTKRRFFPESLLRGPGTVFPMLRQFLPHSRRDLCRRSPTDTTWDPRCQFTKIR